MKPWSWSGSDLIRQNVELRSRYQIALVARRRMRDQRDHWRRMAYAAIASAAGGFVGLVWLACHYFGQVGT